jgi:hypothetical protein
MQSGQGRAVIDTGLANRYLHGFILTTLGCARSADGDTLWPSVPHCSTT